MFVNIYIIPKGGYERCVESVNARDQAHASELSQSLLSAYNTAQFAHCRIIACIEATAQVTRDPFTGKGAKR